MGVAAVVLMGLASQMALISHLLDAPLVRSSRSTDGESSSVLRNSRPLQMPRDVAACDDWKCKPRQQSDVAVTAIVATAAGARSQPVSVGLVPPPPTGLAQPPSVVASGRSAPTPAPIAMEEAAKRVNARSSPSAAAARKAPGGPREDFFTTNRARPGEEASVSTASMTDFIATGGRFPILMITCDRAEMLDKTLESLLAVRGVRASDVYVVQVRRPMGTRKKGEPTCAWRRCALLAAGCSTHSRPSLLPSPRLAGWRRQGGAGCAG